MRIKSVIGAVAAAALVSAPVAATAQTAPAAVEVAPESEKVEGEELRGGFILPLVVIIAIIVGIILLTRDEDPQSP